VTLMQVPVIDIAPYRSGNRAAARRVADRVGEACRDIGFLVIAGHGIDPALVTAWTRPRAPSSICRWRIRCAWCGPRPT
jgi:isopenicillin N synthase-like dioxygenase